jgi:putative alpha-1,2-mannosidase
LYNQANEPDIAVPFMFNFTDKPYLTQKIVNELLTKNTEQWYGTHEKWKTPYVGRIYKLDPIGYIPEMDDDAGTMAAWYVLASIGFYPALVGEPVYTLTAPIFSSVSIQLPENKTFLITAENVSDEIFYIQKAILNGKEINRCWIKQDEITNGGTLEFILGKTPNLTWGTSEPYITQINHKEYNK